MTNHYLLICSLLLSLLSPLQATADQNNQAEPVTEFSLDNGLKVLIREDHRAPVAVSQVWYRVGSSYEHGG
ncbi:MAG: hypothetical protein KUG81_06735, partial [Gammaproteobacteria bacterium]|nr:hypothetical protein [Gammaproteobacteria bacterium]